MNALADSHLVLIHGALGTKSQLASLALSLRDERTVHCVEREGHGETLAGESRARDEAGLEP